MVGTATITNILQYLWLSPEEKARREAEKRARQATSIPPSVVGDRSFMTNGSIGGGLGTTMVSGRATPATPATMRSVSPTPSGTAASQRGISAAPTPAMSVRGLQQPSVAGTPRTPAPSLRGIPALGLGAPARGTPAASVYGTTPAPSIAASAYGATPGTKPGDTATIGTPAHSVHGSIQAHPTPAPSTVDPLQPGTLPGGTPAPSIPPSPQAPSGVDTTAPPHHGSAVNHTNPQYSSSSLKGTYWFSIFG